MSKFFGNVEKITAKHNHIFDDMQPVSYLSSQSANKLQRLADKYGNKRWVSDSWQVCEKYFLVLFERFNSFRLSSESDFNSFELQNNLYGYRRDIHDKFSVG